MDAYEYSELLKLLNTKLKNIEGILKPKELKKRLDEIIELESNQDFWNDVENATKIGIEKNRILGKLNKFNKAFESLNGTNELYELATSEKDDDTFELLYEEAEDLEDLIKSTEISVMLSNPDDASNAIVTIHPGAGGTESQDWASILYRMYLRWAERNDFKVEVLDYQAGDEAGIKDVSFIIRGENAYGYLKTENGIHRLVRISPFDSNAKRHTSFTSVMVSPEIDDNIDIVIEDKDIRIDTYRASGAGGQHVNKTESAIRITHIPSGIVVQCQNDRSQHKNKDSAFKMLKSKLYELELNKQKASKDSGDKSENGWGHQIRSYVLQPYQQVKDSRSNIGYSNVEAILDGDITKMMEDVLIATNKE
ncbi:MAG TPA: peptide chain release factor 2 [Aliarcobacter thereius]|nr:peptide chain release factor 2 [Aliarcobacter thereius]HJE03626.1 peptide chain release factor 2 [Aliarcobacter thereius]